MDSLFESFMGDLPAFSGMFGTGRDRGFALAPHIDVRESDKEIVVKPSFPASMRRTSHSISRMASSQSEVKRSTSTTRRRKIIA